MNNIAQKYERQTFREIRPCTEMDIIRKGMAKQIKRQQRNKAIKDWTIIVMLLVGAVFFVLYVVNLFIDALASPFVGGR